LFGASKSPDCKVEIDAIEFFKATFLLRTNDIFDLPTRRAKVRGSRRSAANSRSRTFHHRAGDCSIFGYAAIFPRLLALDLHRAKDFRLLGLPFKLPRMEIRVHSHSRFANDTGIKWMCQKSASILSKKNIDTVRAKSDGR
jgi:hypothetical protein